PSVWVTPRQTKSLTPVTPPSTDQTPSSPASWARARPGVAARASSRQLGARRMGVSGGVGGAYDTRARPAVPCEPRAQGLPCAPCGGRARRPPIRTGTAPMRPAPIRLAPLACALLLAACGGGSGDGAAGGEAGKELNVYNWSDYVAEDTIEGFEQATGIKVNYDVYSENETLETKLTTGSSGYDVVFPSARPFAQRQIGAGLYAPLDKARLPHWSHLDEDVLAGLTDIDPGNNHVVPYMWGTTGLGINVDKVQAALGPAAPLDSWQLRYDPANEAKLAARGIHVLDDDQQTFGTALIWLGRDPNAGTVEDIERVKQAYAAIRPHVRTFNNAAYKDALANGDACL